MEIVNFLAEVHGFKRFLEISTATTGARFGDADKRNFGLVHRLAYNVPASFDDGLPIDFRSETGVMPHFTRGVAAVQPGGRPRQ